MRLIITFLLVIIYAQVTFGQHDSIQKRMNLNYADSLTKNYEEYLFESNELINLLEEKCYYEAIGFQFKKVKFVGNNSSIDHEYEELLVLDSLLEEHSSEISQEIRVAFLIENFQLWINLNERAGLRKNTIEKFEQLMSKYTFNTDSLSDEVLKKIEKSLRTVGGNYFKINEYEEAIDYFKQAYRVSLDIDLVKSRISRASLNLGYISNVYLDINEIPDTSKIFYEHLLLAQRLLEYGEINVGHLRTAYRRLAGLHLWKNNLDSSVYYLEKSEGLGSMNSKSINYYDEFFKARLLLKQGKIQNAINLILLLNDSLNDETHINNTISIDIYLEVANLLIDVEMYSDAKKLLSFIESEYNDDKRSSNKDQISRYSDNHYLEILLSKVRLKGLYNVNISLQELRDAYEIIDVGMEGVTSKFSRLRFASQSDKLTKYFLTFYAEGKIDIEDVFFAIGSSKAAASTREWLKNQLIDLSSNESIFFQESEFETRLQNLTKNLEYSNDSLNMLSVMNNINYNIQSLDSIKRILSVEYPIYYRMKYNWSIPSIADVQKTLDDNEVLIDYYEGLESLYAIIIANDYKHLVKIDSVEKIKELSNQFKNEILEKKNWSKNTSDLSNRLYQKLIATLRPYLKDRIIISHSTSLFQVPFDALDTNNGEDSIRYLIFDHSISYTPSASIFHQMRTMEEDNKVNNALLVAPKFAESKNSSRLMAMRSNLDSLEYNVPEVLNISNFMENRTFLNEFATKESVLKIMNEVDLIHLATHAKSNMDSPNKSYVAFYREDENASEKDNLLFLNDISKQKLKAKMVVLSACETGLGHVYKGEGAMTLANSFFYAGGRSVVASLWSAADQATSDIMHDFYSQLDQGLTKDKAMQQARIDYLKNNPGTDANPYYWAGFSVMGNTNSLRFKRTPNYRNWLYTLFGAIAIFLFFLQIRSAIKK